MISFVARHPVAFVFSLVLHTLILLALIFSPSTDEVVKVQLKSSDEILPTSEQNKEPPVKALEPMKTFTVDAAEVQKQLADIKAQEEEKQRQQEALAAQTVAEKKRLEEIKRKQQQENQRAAEARKQAEAEKRRAEEASRLAEIERKKVEAQQKRAQEETRKAEQARKEALQAEQKRQEAKRKVEEAEKQRKAEEERRLAIQEQIKKKAEEKKQLEAEALAARLKREQEQEEADLMRRLAAEESKKREAAKAKEMQNLKQVYISNIAEEVRRNWRTAAKVSDDAQCVISITQTPAGKISRVSIDQCNKFANEQFKKDAEKAVYRSEPLPPPPVKELFERNIKFIFNP